MTRPAENRCGACGAPLTDAGTLCWGCIDERDGLRDLLGQLTAHVIGAETPRTTGRIRTVIPAGRAGHGRSTAWDTPAREAANLPRMLREATARQTRFAAEPGVRVASSEPVTLPVDHRAGDRLTRLERVVARIVRDTMTATGSMPPGVTWGVLARWVDGHVATVRMQDWAPGALADLRRAAADALRHVDRPAGRIYLGPCDGHDPVTSGPCSGEYVAREGDTTAACTTCRRGVDVEARKRALLEEAAGMWLTAHQVEDLTVALGHARVADSTVDTWGKRQQVQRRRIPAPDGPWHFLLGEVLARLEVTQQRRTKRSA